MNLFCRWRGHYLREDGAGEDIWVGERAVLSHDSRGLVSCSQQNIVDQMIDRSKYFEIFNYESREGPRLRMECIYRIKSTKAILCYVVTMLILPSI